MKNILFVISTITGGGAERTVSTLSHFLSKSENCSVLVNSVSENDYPFYGNVISLGMKPRVKKGIIYQIIAAFKRYFRLKQLKKSGNYDSVISFMESANFLNIITGKGDNCKIIISVRNVLSEEYKGIGKILLLFARLMYKKADYVVAVSQKARLDLVDNLGLPFEKTIVIYNGYDLSRMARGKSHGRSKFITMGRLENQKGQWHLIRAFSKVVEKHPDARLYILGQGELEGLLRNMIDELNLSDNVEMMGFVNNPSKYLQSADCFVFPSIYEGLANAIIEAMINGLPVIASDFGGAREIIASELDVEDHVSPFRECTYGILTPPNNDKILNATVELDEGEKGLALAMIYFAENKIETDYDDNNRYECLARFSIAKAVDGWKRII